MGGGEGEEEEGEGGEGREMTGPGDLSALGGAQAAHCLLSRCL